MVEICACSSLVHIISWLIPTYTVQMFGNHWLIFSLKSFCHGCFSSQKFNLVQEFVNCLIFTREPLLNACCPCTPEQDDSLRSRKSSVHYHACTPSLVEHSSRPYLRGYLSSHCSPAFLIDLLHYLYPGVDAAI